MRRLTRRDLLAGAAAAAGMSAAAAQVSPEPGEREKIEAAIPDRPFVTPLKPRKLLIFDLNVGYGGHPSRLTANAAFERMGRKTGAFETVVSREPSVFERESLRQFDAVFLNNTVGNLFEDPGLRQNLVEFVTGGGGLLGVHGTTVAFTRWKEGGREDWPEFGLMLGGRGANHRAADEHVFIKLDDPDHPLNRPFEGNGFDYRSEFFRVHAPYSRDRVRVLFSIDVQKTDMNQGPSYGKLRREDDDYALAWVRSYGRGRVFYCTIAHAPSVFWDPAMLKFYLAAVQFAVGDMPAPTTPSARLTPAVRAQERLGWRLGLEARVFGTGTLFEAIDRIAPLGLSFMGAPGSQTVSREIPEKFDYRLTDDALRQIRFKLDSAGVRLLTYDVPRIPGDPEEGRKMFEFGRKMGIEAFVSGSPPEGLELLGKLCDEYDIRLALRGIDPEGILKACRGCRRIGACGDLRDWMRSGIDPVEAVNALGDRLITVRWGDPGTGNVESFIREIHKRGIRPVFFGIDPADRGSGTLAGLEPCVQFFNRVSLDLAPGGGR
jgi:hypothetical protein